MWGNDYIKQDEGTAFDGIAIGVFLGLLLWALIIWGMV